MKRVILDECLPKRLKILLDGHDVVTGPEAGNAGMKNGKLLEAIAGEYDVFVTIDSNLEHQQNLSGINFSIIVIHATSNRFADLEPLGPALLNAVETTPVGCLSHVPQGNG